jgi:hypothetical protein
MARTWQVHGCCHVLAMLLPCHCHVIAMLLPLIESVIEVENMTDSSKFD